jgi:hypothetical protein
MAITEVQRTAVDVQGTAPAAPPAPRSDVRTVGVPSEHGGWSLTAEPVLLGLLVGWSWAGLALGLAAMVAFLTRTPLKFVLVDRYRKRWLHRSTVAARLLAVEAAVLVGLGVLAARTADGRFWPPLAIAAPLVVVQLSFDMRSRSRRLIPEIAGTVGIGSIAAAIALADGVEARVAVGLWCVVAARSAAAIPYVRTQVLRGRGRPHRAWHSDVAQVLGAGVVAVAWALDAVPLAALVAVGVAAGTCLAGVRLRSRPPVVIGTQQMVIGLSVVLVTGLAVLLP